MNLDIVTPFQIDIDQFVLHDLRQRLLIAKWPHARPGPGWNFGTDPDFMRGLHNYWLNGYDWSIAEKQLNRFPQYIAYVATPDGDVIGIHFVIEEGSGENPRPLLMTHGWPGSFFEFMEIIEPLAHPERFGGKAEDGLTVVVPSLPGHTFSEAPPRPLLPREIAAAWARLMFDILGCPRFLTQGGDWGACISAWLAFDEPQAVAAAHFNMVGLRPYLDPAQPLTEEEKAFIAKNKANLFWETGYQQIQGSKPLTLAYGLSDSPIGLAAWLVEKFHGWSDRSASEPPFTKDQLLTNVMLYWVTNCINSSTWIYRAFFEKGSLTLGEGERIAVPCGYCFPSNDLFAKPPSSWLERLGNMVHRTDLTEGGHFMALQAGDVLRRDMQAFFSKHGRF